MGNVPIPVWADNATAKENPAPATSDTSIEVLKSFPNPPYSSGTDTPINPNSPALVSNECIKPGSILSIRSKMGCTSAFKKSCADCAIIFCSSFHSSGIKIEEASLSRIKNSPPLRDVLVLVDMGMR